MAVEPKNPGDMPILIQGLKKLNQADASVEIYVQDSGEHVICAAGEMHLERCLLDLREMFCKIELEVSPPIVSFKETITKSTQLNFATRGNIFSLKVSARPLPPSIVSFLSANEVLAKEVPLIFSYFFHYEYLFFFFLLHSYSQTKQTSRAKVLLGSKVNCWKNLLLKDENGAKTLNSYLH